VLTVRVPPPGTRPYDPLVSSTPHVRRRAAGAVLVLLVGLATACSGGSGAEDDPSGEAGASSTAGAAPTAEESAAALSASTSVLETAVEAAEADAPLPSATTPALGDDLLYSRADLGACDYGDYDTSSGELCPRGDTDAGRSIVVLGDSHGRHWAPALDQVAEADGWTTYYLVKQQCTASMVEVGDPRDARPTQPWAACSDFHDWAMDQVAEIDPDVVVVSTSPPVNGIFTAKGFTRDAGLEAQPYRNGFEALFGQIADATSEARTVLLEDIPVRAAGTEAEVCLTKAGNTQADCLSAEDADARTVALTAASVRAADAAGVEAVDPTPLVCWDGSCPVVVDDGLIPYRGRNHLTVEYVDTLAPSLGALLGL